MATEPKLMTAEELAELEDNGLRYELVRGELRMAPPPGFKHGVIAFQVGMVIGSHVHANGLGLACGAETGFRIARDPDLVRAPDFSFVSHERLPSGPLPDGYLDLAPDLVVEIVSPSDRAHDVQEKMQDWMEAGARLGLLLYPARRRVAVYRSDREVQMLGPDDEIDGGDVLPGFRCRVRDLFPA